MTNSEQYANINISFQGGKTNEQLEGVAMMRTEVSSNLEQPFDFGNNKSFRGEYTLVLEDGSRIGIVLYPDQGKTPYGKFMFYIDSLQLVFFGNRQNRIYADVPGSGPVVLDRFLPKGTIVVGQLKLASVSYVAAP